MSVMYRLVGYNKDDERVGVEYDIPHVVARRVLIIAGVDPDYAGPLGDIPLNENKAFRIADMIGVDLNPDRDADYFLETYADGNSAVSSYREKVRA